MYNNIYSGKKVLITGHTGFKGSWLSIWLLKLGAEVAGFSDKIPTQPSIFEETKLASKVQHHFGDIRDLNSIQKIIQDFKPQFIFHLAAQPIVSVSYVDPVGTMQTNIMGSINVLESLRNCNIPCTVVMITSDKCYENVEWEWGYKETDHLGGRDIYSGSKGAAEIAIHAYQRSFFNQPDCKINIVTGRAGNVIGGGDWAKDRVVVDCMINWSEGRHVEIRSPNATRPWQHVLEPLSGYLTLAAQLHEQPKLNGQSFNFGPRSEQSRTVLDLLSNLSQFWNFNKIENAYKVTDNIPFHEAGLLKLNCDKALFHLRWEANLTYDDCVKYVSEWYFSFYKEQRDMYEFTISQIAAYEKIAQSKGLIWAK